MNRIKTNWPIIIFVFSILAIVFALIAEHFFKILPCKMCLYQRYPYYFLIILSLFFIINKKIPLRFYYWFAEFSFAIGLFYALWHVGIEKKILMGPSGCKNTLQQLDSLSKLKDQIINQSIIACDEITWTILGFSAATINSLLLVLLFIFNTIFLMQIYYDKEKNN